MTYQHLISQVRMASEIAGKPLTSYRPLVDDPEAREDGNSDPEIKLGPPTKPKRERD